MTLSARGCMSSRRSSSRRATPRWTAASRGRTCRARPPSWPARARGAAPAVELVDLVEVDRGVLLGDAAREEGDAGHGAGHAALERAHGGRGDGGGVRLVLAVDAR